VPRGERTGATGGDRRPQWKSALGAGGPPRDPASAVPDSPSATSEFTIVHADVAEKGGTCQMGGACRETIRRADPRVLVFALFSARDRL